MTEPKDPFYVGIADAKTIRKELLLSSKEVLTALKGYEVLKEIRRAKIEAYFELRTVMEELMILNRKLRSVLPKTSLKPMIQKPEPHHVQKQKAEPEKPVHKHTHHQKRPEPRHIMQKDQVELLQEAMQKVDAQLRELESMAR